MEKKIAYALLFSVLILLIFPFVSAVETPIGVETLPNHQVMLNILNPNTGDAIKSLEGNSSADGLVTLTYTSTSSQNVNIYAIIRNSNGKIVLTKQFDGLSTGSALSLKILVAGTAPVVTTTPNVTVNDTPKNITPVNLTQNLTAIKNNSNLSVTNTSSYSFGTTLTNVWNTLKGYALIIGIIIVLILLALILFKYWPNIQRKLDERKVLSKTKEKTIEKESSFGSTKELSNAERKLRQLQEEIDNIKNKNRRISEAERKFEDARRELERLRRE